MPRDDDARINDILEACERIALTWQAASVEVVTLLRALRGA